MGIHNEIFRFLRRNQGKSYKFNHIFNHLRMHPSERNILREALNDMEVSGKIIHDGKFYALKKEEESLLTGEVSTDDKRNYIVLFRDAKNRELREMIKVKKGQVLSAGDKVEFRISKKSDTGKVFARVERVIRKDLVSVTGTFEVRRNYGVVYPDSRAVKKEIYIKPGYYGRAVSGDKVICEILNIGEVETGFNDLEGRIVSVLGKAGEFDTELDAVINKYGFTEKFPSEVLKQSGEIYTSYKSGALDADAEYRDDLRELVCFTIDPEDAKDFDDAVSIKKTESGEHIIGIHIADVSHYVKENSAIDTEALRRGTSVYLADRVVPMLPEVLSNDLCSLRPNEDRLTFSVFITLDGKYRVKDFRITKSVINSKRRFSYEEVQSVIDGSKGDFKKEILLMGKLAKNLTKVRLREGSIDFDSREVKFILDENRQIKEIKIKERLDSMRMIEEFMLLANRCVTEYVTDLIDKHGIQLPFIFRVHDDPDTDKLRDLSEYIKQFGYSLNVKDKQSIKNLLTAIKGKPEEYIINDLLLRSMAKAVYTDKNIGHYGLGFEDYTHFTSPIRRYPDLMVHRILFKYLRLFGGKDGVPASDINPAVSDYKAILPDLCKYCSAQEQSAVAAERESTKVLQIQFIKNRIGEEFDGMISGIVKFGMYVQITEYMTEGMARFRDIEDDYYEYDEQKHFAIGVRRGRVFRAGDKVRIKLINASLETKKIDFLLVK